jgi:hypothetical protein
VEGFGGWWEVRWRNGGVVRTSWVVFGVSAKRFGGVEGRQDDLCISEFWLLNGVFFR